MPVEEKIPPMDPKRFASLRKTIGASQRELAGMLGVSEKAVESYEQGWRRIPGNIERILYFLALRLAERNTPALTPCWELTACPDERRADCLAWRSGEGRYCWFLTGRLCAEKKDASPDTPDAPDDDLLSACRRCPAFARLLQNVQGGTTDSAEVRDAP